MTSILYSDNIDVTMITIGMVLMLAGVLAFALRQHENGKGGLSSALLLSAFFFLALREWTAVFGIADYIGLPARIGTATCLIAGATCFFAFFLRRHSAPGETWRRFAVYACVMAALFAAAGVVSLAFHRSPDAVNQRAFRQFLLEALVLFPAALPFLFRGQVAGKPGSRRLPGIFIAVPLFALLLAIAPDAGITAELRRQSLADERWFAFLHFCRLLVAFLLVMGLWTAYARMRRLEGRLGWLPIALFAMLLAVFFVFATRIKDNYGLHQEYRMLAAAEAAANLIDADALAAVGVDGHADARVVDKIFDKTRKVGFRLPGFTTIRTPLMAAVPAEGKDAVYLVRELAVGAPAWKNPPPALAALFAGGETSSMVEGADGASSSPISLAGVRNDEGRVVGAAVVRMSPVDKAVDLAAFGRRYFLYAIVSFLTMLLFLASQFRTWNLLHAMDIKTIEDDSKKHSDFLQSIINALSVPVLVKDFSGTFLFANRAFGELVGLPPEDIVGKNDHDFLSPEKAFISRQADAASRNLAKSDRSSITEMHLDVYGPSRLFEVIKTARTLGADDRGIIIVAMYNVAEREKAEQDLLAERHFLVKLMDTVPVMICFLDKDGVVLLCDSTFCAMIGKTRNEIIGKRYNQITPFGDDDDPADSPVGEFKERQVEARSADGEKRIFILRQTMMVSPRGKTVGVVKSFWDTTQLLEAQMAADAANKAKSVFLANMSHELRTPLNAVIGLAGEISARETAVETKVAAELIVNSSRALQMVLEEIVDIAVADDREPFVPDKPFDLRQLVDDLVRIGYAIADPQSKRLSLFMPGSVARRRKGDIRRLRQILLHLLSKCVKWTDSPVVRLSVNEAAEGMVNFDFFFAPREGMEVDAVRSLLEESEVVSGVVDERLSLPPLGELVRLRGGSIEVEEAGENFPGEDKPPIRARISISLPEDPSGGTASTPDFSGLRALAWIADPDSRFAAANYLETAGATVLLAEDAAAAGRLLRSAGDGGEAADLVLVDMVDNDPGEVARFLREAGENVQGGGPKILALVGAIGMAFGADSEKRPADAYLPLPVLASELWKKVDELWNGMTPGPAEIACCATGPRPSGRNPKRRPCAVAGVKVRAKVLLVEDNPVNQVVAKGILSRIGCSTVIAKNGEEAVKKVEAGETFDLIVMDCMMPVMDGYEASAAIRTFENSHPGQKRRPIVALTANALPGNREKCLDAGMDDYLTKPVSVDEMLHAVISHCPGACVPDNPGGKPGDDGTPFV